MNKPYLELLLANLEHFSVLISALKHTPDELTDPVLLNEHAFYQKMMKTYIIATSYIKKEITLIDKKDNDGSKSDES